MKKRNRIDFQDDERGIAIYARKSRITNKGDSIGVQFKQSAEYAINQMGLAQDYPFQHYEDKGLSGYYSDRPDFQRLLRDIEAGKIKAVVCYKLDRISRKTSDLMRLLEFLERFDVALLVCSNNINTRNSTSKIIIQVLAIIAEFERDTLTERVQDNLMELAKDGRWLGGMTPTGFASERISTGSGKNKSAVSFLVSIEEEKKLVQKIFDTLLSTRSICRTADIIGKEHKTKKGSEFTPLAVRDIVKNPIYCTADERAYQYFLERDGNIFGERTDFDGQHGISVYNKTDQFKVEDEDSTFFNPKFCQVSKKKDVSEWIIAVGRHEGFISSEKWIAAQGLLEEIADRWNRPHRKTNALLSGLMYCPNCGRRLTVIPESDRWTNGKPRFKYVCPGYRKKECTFKAVDGVLMDEFLVDKLENLSHEESEYYEKLFADRIETLISSDEIETDYRNTKKELDRTRLAISNQIRNMRDANDVLRKYIQDDVDALSAEAERLEAELRRIEAARSGSRRTVEELGEIRKMLFSFSELAKDASSEELTTLINSVVERIYITTEDDRRVCHIFVKGCPKEDYEDLFGAAGYIGTATDSGPAPLSSFLCDPERDRELHTYLCGRAAAERLCRDHEKAGIRRTHWASKNYVSLQSSVRICDSYGWPHCAGKTYK